jgi:uncharacterized protein YcbK (DUF882 family)
MRQPRRVNIGGGRAGWLCASTVALALVVFAPPHAVPAREARQTHVVKAGESVAEIADFYGVSQRDLRELNGLSESRGLRVGQPLKIPNVLRVSGTQYKVKKGDTVASVATAFGRSPRQIALANKIGIGAALREGRTLVIPDKGATSKGIEVAGQEIETIAFLRVRTGERETLGLFTRKGALDKGSVTKLSYLCREKVTNKVKRLNVRLVKMIQRIAQEFPDKPIEIISGYRASEVGGQESQHAFGRALDFRIPGVPLQQIFRACKSQPRSGCGIYPKSGFVHMDAREKNATWRG